MLNLVTLVVLSLPLDVLAITVNPDILTLRRAGGDLGEILAGAPVNNITVSADNVLQCSDATISWTGTTPPVTLMIGLGGYYVGTTDLITIPDIPTSPYSWAVNQASGVDLIFQVTDASGAVGYIQNIKVGSSTDSSCLSAAAKVVSSTTSSRSTTVQSSMMTSSTNAGYVPATTTSIDYASAVASTSTSETASPDDTWTSSSITSSKYASSTSSTLRPETSQSSSSTTSSYSSSSSSFSPPLNSTVISSAHSSSTALAVVSNTSTSHSSSAASSAALAQASTTLKINSASGPVVPGLGLGLGLVVGCLFMGMDSL
ncbi:MAG: hypothetical protein TREMPRED_002059 [Tremellales sp. Tagirdzhanova-0007]|nr:MAG: hypothetical protein TREMPRED_002059 [Tremellales sp. Tagirdzhanova-0007]